MLWMLLLFSVDTHVEIPLPKHVYESAEACLADADAVAKNGVSYALCRPVTGTAKVMKAE